jgi:hypothetical protein
LARPLESLLQAHRRLEAEIFQAVATAPVRPGHKVTSALGGVSAHQGDGRLFGGGALGGEGLPCFDDVLRAGLAKASRAVPGQGPTGVLTG